MIDISVYVRDNGVDQNFVLRFHRFVAERNRDV
jgi:hypothetical protein